MAKQGTNSLNAESSMPPKKFKKAITLNIHGLPVGDNSAKLSSRCRHLVRTIITISYKDWHAVPNEKKDELWKLLLHSMTSGLQASAAPLKNKESVVVSNSQRKDQSPLTLQPCKMMSWRQEVVTLGRAYIENGPQQIHSKSLPTGYYKVSVDVIEKTDVELPYPDGFHSTLGEVGNGSFVAWPDVFTIFMD